MKIGNLFKGDRVIWMVLLFLCLISVVEVFSASSTLTYKSQDYLGPIIGHTWKILVGVGMAILILNVPCRLFKLATPGLLIISVIMLIYGGLRYVLSGGDSKKVTDAKNTIMYAIIGLIISILAYAIVNFVINAVGGEATV